MSDFDRAFPIIWFNENGALPPTIAVSNDPTDPGGFTRAGIALNEHPGMTREQLEAMTFADIKAYYLAHYWLPEFDNLTWPLSVAVFDGYVNEGGDGIKVLQMAVGTTADGVMGPITAAAAVARNPVDLTETYMFNRDNLYRQSRNLSTEGNGWIRRLFYTTYAAGLAAS